MSAMPALAVDLGGTGIKIGIVRDGAVIAHRTIPAHSAEGLENALPRIGEAADACLAAASLQTSDLDGLGMAFAGLVDSAAKRIIGSNGKYEDGASVDLAAWANGRWGLPLVLDNDARMATVGEWRYGAGRGLDDPGRPRFDVDSLWLKPPAEMWHEMGDAFAEGLHNANAIAEACDVELELGKVYLPSAPIDEEGHDDEDDGEDVIDGDFREV